MNIDKLFEEIEMLPYGNEKNEKVENLFHISLWNMMNEDQRIKLLQLLENCLAFNDGREPSEIYLIEKMPHMATASCYNNKIKVSRWHLMNGLNYLKTMNAQMYSAIVHEHTHISEYMKAISDSDDELSVLFRNNYSNMIPYRDNSVRDYIKYRFQPIEYYAHDISETMTRKTFKRLIQVFGSDEGYEKWEKEVGAVTIANLVKLYNREYNTSLTFDEIYQMIIQEIQEKVDKTR